MSMESARNVIAFMKKDEEFRKKYKCEKSLDVVYDFGLGGDRNFDNMICEYLGNTEFELVPVEELSNGEHFHCNPDGKVDEDDLKVRDDWKAGEFQHFTTETLMNCMVHDDFIPKGNYMVECFW
jgi:hypothetical protein